MKRVLLIIEGFNELAYTETLLKKVGFDCTGTQNELGIADKILSFRPQVILATCRGRKVKGETLLERLSSKGLHLPALILLAADQSLTEFERSHSRAQHILISPVSPSQLIETLADALEMDSAALIKKLGRDLDPSMAENKLEFYVKGGAGPLEEMTSEERAKADEKAKREEKAGREVQAAEAEASATPKSSRPKRDPSAILKSLPTTPGGLNRKLVEAQTQDFRKREKDLDIKEIDEERQAFVKTLFKIGSES